MANVPLNNYLRNQPEFIETGDITACFRISASATISGGDVILIGKIPHGAIPLDAVFYPNAAVTGIGTFVAKFGTSLSQELFFISATYSAVLARCTRPLGTAQQISVSDDAAVRYDAVVMVATAGASLGFIGELAVTYRMPAQAF